MSMSHGPVRDCPTVVAAVGFHDNYSSITQRFIEACTRVGIPPRADLNTPRGTVGVAKVSGLGGPFLHSDIVLITNVLLFINSSVRASFRTQSSVPHHNAL